MIEHQINIRVRIAFTRSMALWSLGGLLLFVSAQELGSEMITLTTSYPSPIGIYRSMITTGANSSNTLLARDGGSVGIGTASPNAKLEIDDTFPLLLQTTGTGPNNAVLRVQDNSGTPRFELNNDNFNNEGPSLNFYGNDNNGWFNFLAIDEHSGSRATALGLSGGKVGIGTANPNATLDVSGNVYIGHTRNIGPVPLFLVNDNSQNWSVAAFFQGGGPAGDDRNTIALVHNPGFGGTGGGSVSNRINFNDDLNHSLWSIYNDAAGNGSQDFVISDNKSGKNAIYIDGNDVVHFIAPTKQGPNGSRFVVSSNQLDAYNPNCPPSISGGIFGETGAGQAFACVSACDGYCQQANGFSGGTMTQYSSNAASDGSAQVTCVCSP